jgi:hypothetical protein
MLLKEDVDQQLFASLGRPAGIGPKVCVELVYN